ncbi:hypothetical protein [Filimonas effusa]|uniref:Uncharacterized protein n=1 Tax=Filimonas effusa TaxID=2508721 RepID=A0A4Q1D5N9_9BACT|nr:hypothetical protein [Filimonas effusa]RXK83815.1 hypothetical protein ESB13_17240 [Filimonas effusa]
MSLKGLISLVLLLVLSIQVLPIRQIGSLLCKNQFTEELPHSPCEVKSPVIKFEPSISDNFASAGMEATLLAAQTTWFVHMASVLPLIHAGEIHTPPPNNC